MKKYSSNEYALPENRLEQFKEVFLSHFFAIILTSIYTLISLFPCLIWLIFTAFFDIFHEISIFNDLLIYGVNAILFSLGGLGFAGSFYYFKKVLFNEGGDINKDFFKGIKLNFKSYMLIFFLFGLLYMILRMSVSSILSLSLDMALEGILTGISYLLFFLITFVFLFMLTIEAVYVVTFKQCLLNSIKLTFGYLYKNIGFFIIFLLPFFIYEFVPNDIAKIVAILVEGFFYFGFSFLVFMSYSNYVFDKTINKEHYKELIRKGLRSYEDCNDK